MRSNIATACMGSWSGLSRRCWPAPGPGRRASPDAPGAIHEPDHKGPALSDKKRPDPDHLPQMLRPSGSAKLLYGWLWFLSSSRKPRESCGMESLKPEEARWSRCCAAVSPKRWRLNPGSGLLHRVSSANLRDHQLRQLSLGDPIEVYRFDLRLLCTRCFDHA